MYENLNNIYITDRLATRLFEIENHTVTTVIAPLGYGKTTAISHWQTQMLQKNPDAVILRQSILSDSLGELWRRFCKLLASINSPLSERLLKVGFPQHIRDCGLVAELWEENKISDSASVWWILDDVHLLQPNVLSPLILSLSEKFEGLRVVLISRNRILTRPEQLKLGRNLCEIRMNDLALTESELQQYAANCGVSLNYYESEIIMKLSEGWISLIYLFFRSKVYGENLGFDAPDIFALIDQVMLEPLTERERSFLIRCSVTEEFTQEQSAFLWQGEDAEVLLTGLSDNNAFITVSENGFYRFHNMLLQSVRQRFNALSEKERRAAYERLGDWHFQKCEFLNAMNAYRNAEKWENLLKAIVADRGNSLDGEQRNVILDWLTKCPKEFLRSNPEALLVLTLACFTVGAIDEMLQTNNLMLEATQHNPNLTKKEQNNYLGESQVLLSFLQFNSISGMSKFQKLAGRLMTRPTKCLDLKSPWTFGSPSILSLYHRVSGTLDNENSAMKDCMPYYEKISQGHGSGAENIFEAEICFFRGNLNGAKIALYQALEKAEEKEQYSILTAAAFLGMRINLMEGNFLFFQKRLKELREKLKHAGQFFLLNTADMCKAWCYAILGRPDSAPTWVADSSATFMKEPAWASFLTICDQVRLSRGEYQRVIASAEKREALFEKNHAMLPSIYLHVQLAGANFAINRCEDAKRELKTAIELAQSDNLWLPFAENGQYIHELFKEIEISRKTRNSIFSMTEHFTEARKTILKKYFPSSWDVELTEREKEVAKLAARRLTVREISEALSLSENTIKTHIKHIYEKLNITGTERNKRARLENIIG